MNARQRGTALLLVLWATILLAALIAGVAASSRSQSQAALYGSERVRAELAAEAGLAHAVAGLRAPDLAHQWVPDGRPYHFEFDGAQVTVRVVDVNGLVDLNAAPPRLLQALFTAVGVNDTDASRLADTIVQWRSATPLPTNAPAAGGAAPGARGQASAALNQARGPFRAIDQLARVPGVDLALYDRVAPSVTVFSGRNFPDVSFAGSAVLAALRGVTPQQAKSLVDSRRRQPAQRGVTNGQAFGAVANGPLVAGYGGVVQRVFSVAEMPDGTRVGLDATLRMALTGTMARPYKVLAWRMLAPGF
ncbi:MAG TPA: type II secretion system protein GspK [Rhodanobacteraceae bacterium]|nr:type II secretion system protein GspK [Rhodanobacteraceae bacterium]